MYCVCVQNCSFTVQPTVFILLSACVIASKLPLKRKSVSSFDNDIIGKNEDDPLNMLQAAAGAEEMIQNKRRDRRETRIVDNSDLLSAEELREQTKNNVYKREIPYDANPQVIVLGGPKHITNQQPEQLAFTNKPDIKLGQTAKRYLIDNGGASIVEVDSNTPTPFNARMLLNRVQTSPQSANLPQSSGKKLTIISDVNPTLNDQEQLERKRSLEVPLRRGGRQEVRMQDVAHRLLKRSAFIMDAHNVSRNDSENDPGLEIEYTLVEKIGHDHNEQFIHVTIIDASNTNTTQSSNITKATAQTRSTTAPPTTSTVSTKANVTKNSVTATSTKGQTINATIVNQTTASVLNVNTTNAPMAAHIPTEPYWSAWYNRYRATITGDKDLLSDMDPNMLPCGQSQPIAVQCEPTGGVNQHCYSLQCRKHQSYTCLPAIGMQCLNDAAITMKVGMTAQCACCDYKIRYKCAGIKDQHLSMDAPN